MAHSRDIRHISWQRVWSLTLCIGLGSGWYAAKQICTWHRITMLAMLLICFFQYWYHQVGRQSLEIGTRLMAASKWQRHLIGDDRMFSLGSRWLQRRYVHAKHCHCDPMGIYSRGRASSIRPLISPFSSAHQLSSVDNLPTHPAVAPTLSDTPAN